jgi:hypothetical protein
MVPPLARSLCHPAAQATRAGNHACPTGPQAPRAEDHHHELPTPADQPARRYRTRLPRQRNHRTRHPHHPAPRQDTAVGTGEDSAGGYVTVRVGRVLIYTYGEDTTAVHVAGWRQADTLARRSFPAGYQAEPADLRDANTASVGYAGLHVAGTPDSKDS